VEALATRSFVVGGKSMAASRVYIASYCACAVARRAS
jgi:hypothetical protein